jgi:hypothetical protein
MTRLHVLACWLVLTGSWKPAVNLSTLLASIQQLIADPNPDDGLVPEITQEFKRDRAVFDSIAREQTAKHAIDSQNATIRGQKQSAMGVRAGPATSEVLPHAQTAEGEESDEDEEKEEHLVSLYAIGNCAKFAGKIQCALFCGKRSSCSSVQL